MCNAGLPDFTTAGLIFLQPLAAFIHDMVGIK